MITKIITGEVESNRDDLTLLWAAVHDLVLDKGLVICLLLLACSIMVSGTLPDNFFSDDSQLHVLDLDLHQIEVDLSSDYITKVILRFEILEINMQAFFNADLDLLRMSTSNFNEL
jgi:hypothetical protein